MDRVITLVHGTWAGTSGWVATGSFLRRELEQRFPHVTFRAFQWAGTNTHAARTEAGTRLAQFIRDGSAQHPHAQHFIVAHSHGGNVALYAMQDPAARDLVSGIVTLGTPFIHVRRRDRGRYIEATASLMLVVAALVLFALLGALGLGRLRGVWLIGAAFLIVKMTPRFSRWLTETATREQDDILGMLQPPAIDGSKLAVLCTDGDEAGRWLRTWDVVAQGPLVIGCLLLSLLEGASRANLPALVDGVARSTLHLGLDDIRVFGFDSWTLIVGLVLLCVIWGVVVLCSSVVRWPGYWREPLFTNVLVDIRTDRVPRTADGTPFTTYTFDVPAPAIRSRRTHGLLRHTAICDDPAVAAAIGEWISRMPAPAVATRGVR